MGAPLEDLLLGAAVRDVVCSVVGRVTLDGGHVGLVWGAEPLVRLVAV